MTETKTLELEAALREIPIFPLSQVILFPHAVMPLHIFEPRYRALLKDAMGTHKAIAMALIVGATETDAHGNPKIAKVAGAGLIVEHQEMPDGRANIMLHGRARIALEELPFVPPYRRAKATILRDLPRTIPPTERAALLASANAFATDVRNRDPNFSFRLPQNVEAGVLADLCAHHLVIDATLRQSVLEELDPVERIRMVTAALASQHSTIHRESGGILH